MDVLGIASRIAISRRPTLKGVHSQDEMVDWAYSEVLKKNPRSHSFMGHEIIEDGTKHILMVDGKPAAYLSANSFKDGYQVSTTAMKPEFSGQKLSTILYQYIISKKPLYSDKTQTPEARKLWVILSGLFDVIAVDTESGEEHKVYVDGRELKSDSIDLYVDSEPHHVILKAS